MQAFIFSESLIIKHSVRIIDGADLINLLQVKLYNFKEDNMYLIKWIDQGISKSYVAEGWIEEMVKTEELQAADIEYTTELI